MTTRTSVAPNPIASKPAAPGAPASRAPQAEARSVGGAAHTGRVARDHGHIAFDLQGPDDGPLAVLAPGLGDLRAEYRYLAPRLAAQGWRVATVDLRGHGDSSPSWPSYTTTDVAGDLLAVVDHLGGPAVLVGNSFSAGSAVWASVERPDLVAGRVLIGPFVRDHPTPWWMRAAMAVLFAGPWRVRAWDAYYASLFPSRAPDDLADHRRALRRNLAEPGRFAAATAMMAAGNGVVERRLAEVGVPTLVVMGSEDPDFPDPAAEAAWIAERTDGDVAMIDDAGHYPQSERPDATAAAILAFLDGLPIGNGRGRA